MTNLANYTFVRKGCMVLSGTSRIEGTDEESVKTAVRKAFYDGGLFDVMHVVSTKDSDGMVSVRTIYAALWMRYTENNNTGYVAHVILEIEL